MTLTLFFVFFNDLLKMVANLSDFEWFICFLKCRCCHQSKHICVLLQKWFPKILTTVINFIVACWWQWFYDHYNLKIWKFNLKWLITGAYFLYESKFQNCLTNRTPTELCVVGDQLYAFRRHSQCKRMESVNLWLQYQHVPNDDADFVVLRMHCECCGST